MGNENYNDEHIVKRVLQGDADLFRVIIERYQKNIFIIGMRFYKNEEDALDFVQDVFLKVYDKLNTFKGISKFYFWLTRVAYNHGINTTKGRILDSSLIETCINSNNFCPEKNHLNDEIRKALMKALEKLPGRYRLCLDLYFFQGLPYIEIEKITNIPINTIKSNVLRAKRILRDALRGSIAEEYYEMQ